MNRPSRSGDRGVAVVGALTLTFVFMAGALIWLSAVVDRSTSDRAQAASVAFQAARAGAQQTVVSTSGIAVDHARAAAAARDTAARLLASNHDRGGVVAIAIDGDRVTVTVAITTTGRRAVGTGTARARAGFDGGDQ